MEQEPALPDGSTVRQELSTVNDSAPEDAWEELIKLYHLRPLTRDGYTYCGIYLLIVGISATLGNTIVIITICRNKNLRSKPHNMLLLNLAISDLGISIFGYPLTTASSFAGRFLFGNVGCVIQGFTCFTLAQANINTLACLAVYRLVAVCHHQYNPQLKTHVKKVILFAWLYSLMWTGPPLLGWSAYTFEPFGTACSIDWSCRKKESVAYTWCLIAYCYCFHIIVIATCYYKIVRKAKTVGRRITSRRGYSLRKGENEFREQRERRITMFALAMTLAFIIVWSPYACVSMMAVYMDTIPTWLNVLPTLFAKMSCMLNPILYAFINPAFRSNIYNFCCKERQDTTTCSVPLYLRRRDTTKDDVYVGLRKIAKQ